MRGTWWSLARWTLAFSAVAIGCQQPAPPRVEPIAIVPRILTVEAPSPVLIGSVLAIRGQDLRLLGPKPTLRVDTVFADSLSDPEDDFSDVLRFELPAELIASGTRSVTLTLLGGGMQSEPFVTSFEFATDLTLAVEPGPLGDVHRNDVVVLRGEGFISESEGPSFAVLDGTFTADGGSPESMEVLLPLFLLEAQGRDRAFFELSTELGGLTTGVFEGDLYVESTLRGAREPRRSERYPTTMRFVGPELFNLEPNVVALGQLVRVFGAGFLGDEPDEATLIRIEGSFTSDGVTRAIEPVELVPIFDSGTEVRLPVEVATSGEGLISTVFGAARGVFAGTATPVVLSRSAELRGEPVPFSLELVGTTQVVQLRFLPGFYTSLARFGLASAADEIERGIRDRIESIYSGYRLEIRLDLPADYSPEAYSVLEIGGPDPTGTGLFGYDNTPGKDVGNLRLFDRIGGTNAETQMDGFPGFGGVFVESILWWSSHPELPEERPFGAPSPEPLFDVIFDPTRARPASRDEIVGDAQRTRVEEIRRAIGAFCAVVGETAAHELGHSLGMAEPYGSPSIFHNIRSGEGCLMDEGAARPFGERAAQPGFGATHLCYDGPGYLTSILGS